MKSKFRLKDYVKPLDALVLGLVIIIRAVYFHFCNEICRTVDTMEYLRVRGVDFLTGNIDRYRLPVYPLLIDICAKLFGDNYLNAVCIVQLLVSLLSLVALYFALRKLTCRSYVYLPVLVLYGLSNAVFGWDKIILTESLSLSLTVFMIFGLVYYLKDNKLRYLAVAVAAAGIGAFMRSVFAIYAGVIFGFLIIRLIFTGKKNQQERKTQRITDAKGLIFAVIPVVLLMVYGGLFYGQYGGFTLSDSGLGQQLSIVISNGYYKDSSDEELKKVVDDIMTGKIPDSYNSEIRKLITEVYGDKLTTEQKIEIRDAFIKFIEEDEKLESHYIDSLEEFYSQLYGTDSTAASFGSVYNTRCYIMDNYDRDRVSAFVSESKNANFIDYIFSMKTATLEGFAAGYESTKGGNISFLITSFVKRIVPSLRIYLLQGVAIGFAELIVFLAILMKKKRPDWIHLGFATMILATGLLSIAGTNAEYARTALTMFPMLFAVFAIWFDRFITFVVNKELQKRCADTETLTEEVIEKESAVK